MNDIERHPQDPAEGPDYDRSEEDQQQDEERELNDGDDMTKPGGDEPPD